MRANAYLVVLALVGLAGCAGLPGLSRSSDTPQDQGRSAQPLTELPVQTLPPGQCAMVLWARANAAEGLPARRVLFVTDKPGRALLLHRGAAISLGRTDMAGGMQYGHAPRQRFDGAGISAALAVEIIQRRAMSGAIVRAGTLTITSDGSENVIPVIGRIGCS